MNALKTLLLLIVLTYMSCKEKTTPQKADTFHTSLMALFVEDIDNSVEWYTERLGFGIEKEIVDYPDYGMRIAFLELNDFRLELIEKDNALSPDDYLPSPEHTLGGVAKIGLRTQNVETVYNKLKPSDDVNFITEIGTLPEMDVSIEWPTKYFLITDPDGNFIQFFDVGVITQTAPWLTMITVRDLDTQMAWYSDYIGLEHIYTIGEPGNRRAILERNGYVIELWETKSVLPAKDISADTTILGIRKIAFGMDDVSGVDSLCNANGVPVVMSLDSSSFDWADRAMIVLDSEGNWVQLFETIK